MTEDLIQLLTFPEIYVTDERDLTGVKAYAGDHDEVVVYIDISQFWSSGYDAEALLERLADATGYIHAEPLFETGLSATYLISK